MTADQIATKLTEAGFAMTRGTRHRRFTKNGVMVTLPSASHGSSAPWVVSAMKTALRRAAELDVVVPVKKRVVRRHLAARDVVAGILVRALVSFANIPAGTVGHVEHDYGHGFEVMWHTPNPCLDGFDKVREIRFLEAA